MRWTLSWLLYHAGSMCYAAYSALMVASERVQSKAEHGPWRDPSPLNTEHINDRT